MPSPSPSVFVIVAGDSWFLCNSGTFRTIGTCSSLWHDDVALEMTLVDYSSHQCITTIFPLTRHPSLDDRKARRHILLSTAYSWPPAVSSDILPVRTVKQPGQISGIPLMFSWVVAIAKLVMLFLSNCIPLTVMVSLQLLLFNLPLRGADILHCTHRRSSQSQTFCHTICLYAICIIPAHRQHP